MRRVGRIAACFAVAGILALAAIALSPFWLPLPARFLAANDPPKPADAIVVLSGRASERAPMAAELYRRGLAQTVITLGGRNSLSRALGQELTDAQLNARVLERQGVPRSAIVPISRGRRTWEEAQVVKEYAAAHGLQTLILVTSNFGGRRVRWAFRRVLGHGGPRVIVVSAPSPGVQDNDWWRSEDGFIAVVSEFGKLSYYVVWHGALDSSNPARPKRQPPHANVLR